MSQSIDLSAVTDTTFNGSAVEQINLNGSGIWTMPVSGFTAYTTTANSNNSLLIANGIYFHLPGRYDNFIRSYSGATTYDLLKFSGYDPRGEALTNINGELVLGIIQSGGANTGYDNDDNGNYQGGPLYDQIPSGYEAIPIFNSSQATDVDTVVHHSGIVATFDGQFTSWYEGCSTVDVLHMQNGLLHFYPIAKVTPTGFTPYGSVSSVSYYHNDPVIAGQDLSWDQDSVYHGDGSSYAKFTFSGGGVHYSREPSTWTGTSWTCNGITKINIT